jgi:hypothetical protein
MIFDKYQKDAAVRELFSNLLSYFSWCRNCRNQLLHSERHPTAFFMDPDFLHLSKRIGKQSPKMGYLKLTLERIRSIADSMRKGVVQSAELHLYLRYAGTPFDSIPQTYQAFAKLPSKLEIPKLLQLTEKP